MPELPVPSSIVIVGASRDRAKYGNRAVRAYRDAGATVYALNPNAKEVEGAQAFARVEDLPAGAAELASIYTQPEVTAALLPALAAYGIKRAYFNPGAERDDLVAQARALNIEPILACSVTAIGRSPEDYAP